MVMGLAFRLSDNAGIWIRGGEDTVKFILGFGDLTGEKCIWGLLLALRALTRAGLNDTGLDDCCCCCC